MTNECRCGKPTRDEAFVCDDCSGTLAKALGEVPWIAEELETTITRSKGVDYRTKGATAGSERPSPVVWSVSEARANLKAVLVSWVRFCADERVRNQSPHQAIPEDTLPAISRYLMWRVDGLTLLDIGPEAVDEITDAVAQCHRLIDRPAEKQYLGDCKMCPDGRLYVRPGGQWARCNECPNQLDAETLRGQLLESLDDRLCTAAEIAHLSTYLGLRAGREQVKKAVEHLGRKGRIERHSGFSDQAIYRFGDAYAHLAAAEYSRKRSA